MPKKADDGAASGVSKENLAAYFANAKSFDHDSIAALVRSRTVAWCIAGLAVGVACCEGLGMAFLAPLKTVVPYVIRVDNSTGIVDVVSALTDAKETYSDAVSKYFLTQYVIYREGYSDADSSDAFKRVSFMSATDEQRRFAEWYNSSNPLSPRNVDGTNSVVEVTVKGVSFLGPGLAQVRFFTLTRPTDGDDRDAVRADYTSTMQFVYSTHDESDQVRLINPLGFVVTSYRRDGDTSQ